MVETNKSKRLAGLSLRQAALIAGFGLLIMVICGPFSQLYVLPKYLVYDDVAQTIANIQGKPALFVAGILAPFVVLTMDIVVAWALYVLFRPVNPAFSLLTAWMRIIYAAIAFVAVSCLFVAYRMVMSPKAADILGDQMHGHIYLLMVAFNHIWGVALILFGVYLLCLSALILGSSIVPRLLSIPVAIAGAGWIIDSAMPYVAPNLDLDWIFYTFFGELIFMAWLLTGGWFVNVRQQRLPQA